MVEFASPVQAVRAAVAIQRALDRHNTDLPADRRMVFRIGINLGDVIVEDGDLLGDGVNVASRLQEIAAPGGICISGALRDQIDNKLAFPITRLGERTLKNIPRPITVYRVGWRLQEAAEPGMPGDTPSLPDKPSIAVLPFANMSGDPEQEYFADGITEDIITELSRYRWFFVIARNSTFSYKGRSIDVKQVARELGVRYVLEGSVRKAGQRVRITVQLIEAETGNHLWAERYDRDLADVFAVQDEITQSAVGAIEPEILIGEGQRAAQRSPDNLDAYDCFMRGMWHHYRFNPEDSLRAEALFRRAIELDATLARGHLGLSRVLYGRARWGWSEDTRRDMAAADEAARRATELDPRDAYAHYMLAMTSVMTGRHRKALAEAQQAVDHSPNFALGYFSLGWTRIGVGHFAEALDPLQRCLRLSPNDPILFEILTEVSLAHYQLGNYEEAAHYGECALRIWRPYSVLLALLAALGQLGRLEEAAPLIEEAHRVEPPAVEDYLDVTVSYADPAHREHFLDGLRKAGLLAPAPLAADPVCMTGRP